jgi:uncharacterized protein DUF3560
MTATATATNASLGICPCECTCGEGCDHATCPCSDCVEARGAATAPTEPAPSPASEPERELLGDATYDAADNKIRMRFASRLPKDVYERVRAAGFIWAARQELFVAPAWSPEREDLAEELCGELGDEDTSLIERAEERADRFDDYAHKRGAESDAEHRKVERICDAIPFGQPILVGHHSERHARRDQERIHNGMAKAISLWKTSEHWKARAASAIRHAEYKERPAVRYRRIKGLEADLRKFQRDLASSDADGSWRERTARWVTHTENRLAYERAMLGEVGGIAATACKWDLQVGGRIAYRFGTAVIVRVNRKDGAVTSVSVPSGYSWTTKVSVEDIRDYTPPAEGDGAKVKAASSLGPVVNRQGDGFVEMTEARWKEYTKARRSSCLGRQTATDTHGAFRTREVCSGGNFREVFLTDAKRVDPPSKGA